MRRLRVLIATLTLAAVAAFFMAGAAYAQGTSPGAALDEALSALSDGVADLAGRVGLLEDSDAAQDTELADHEERIAALEAGTPPPPPPPPPAPACANGLDDDGDGLIDFPADPGCESAEDTDEADAPPPPPGEVVCLVSNRDTWSLAGTNCAYGTLIEFTNEQFRCNAPLASYGELPLKLVWTFTGNPDFGDQGHMMFGSGCHGDANEDTIDVVVQSNADGRTVGACGGAGKFQQNPGPRDIQITGNFDSGPLCGAAHQDVWQFHPDNTDARLDIVNGTSGDWEAGTSTTIGAGGAIFFSNRYDVDVFGGRYVTCNHGYFGNSSPSNLVEDAGFRTGRTDGSDPKCVSVHASDPCVGSAAFVRVIAERWLDGRWQSRPCRA